MKTYIQPATILLSVAPMLMQVASPGPTPTYEPTLSIGGGENPNVAY